MAEFYPRTGTEERDVPHSEQNIIGGLMGASGAILLAAMAPGPMTWALAGKATVAGFMPFLAREGAQQVLDPQQTVQTQALTGRNLARPGASGPSAQYNPMSQAEQVAPWTPEFMGQMGRYG